MHELALEAAVEMRAVDPWTDETLRALNPLCKVPALQIDGGTTLFDSPVICEYLDCLVGGRLLAPRGRERWDALRRQALASGLADAVIRRHLLSMETPSAPQEKNFARQSAAIDATMRELERNYADADGRPFDLGDAAVIAALRYFQFRSPDLAAICPAPRLASWQSQAERRPSCIATRADTPVVP